MSKVNDIGYFASNICAKNRVNWFLNGFFAHMKNIMELFIPDHAFLTMNIKHTLPTLILMLAMILQSSCAVVGYSSLGGWFFWPPGWVGLAVLISFLLFMLFPR